MNGDQASAQLRRIRDMVKNSQSQCRIEEVPGELDSVHLVFHCGEKQFYGAWTGEQLAAMGPEELWRELEVKTQGSIKKPQTADSN